MKIWVSLIKVITLIKDLNKALEHVTILFIYFTELLYSCATAHYCKIINIHHMNKTQDSFFYKPF